MRIQTDVLRQLCKPCSIQTLPYPFFITSQRKNPFKIGFITITDIEVIRTIYGCDFHAAWFTTCHHFRHRRSVILVNRGFNLLATVMKRRALRLNDAHTIAATALELVVILRGNFQRNGRCSLAEGNSTLFRLDVAVISIDMLNTHRSRHILQDGFTQMQRIARTTPFCNSAITRNEQRRLGLRCRLATIAVALNDNSFTGRCPAASKCAYRGVIIYQRRRQHQPAIIFIKPCACRQRIISKLLPLATRTNDEGVLLFFAIVDITDMERVRILRRRNCHPSLLFIQTFYDGWRFVS